MYSLLQSPSDERYEVNEIACEGDGWFVEGDFDIFVENVESEVVGDGALSHESGVEVSDLLAVAS